MKTMQAAVFKGNGILSVEDLPFPVIKRPTQVLLKIRAASICGSDLHGLMVPPAQHLPEGIVMGHEFFGVIEACGENAGGFVPGDRVVVNPAIPCGRCFECTHGHEEICDHNTHYGQTCDGGFAEYLAVESSQLYKVPDGVAADAAAQTEPLACIMGGITKLQPKPDEHVLLYGAGPIGLMYIKVLRALGIRHLAVCAKGEKRKQEAARFGAEIVIDSVQGSIRETLMEKWRQQPDVVIDAVGAGAIFPEAVNLINSGGRILLFGFNKSARSEIAPADFCVKELQVVGSRSKDFPAALSLLSEGRLNLEELVSHRVPLREIDKGIALMRSREATRVIVCP
ncbi:zinc-dependent alcohol dehydrogenase [Ruminococcus gauvreauii]|uniref:Alcohol dehydrogenase catalytic domain-containing protein n=1 Tax=Ruminococcus gauvreauii TaxID=438033 RepID=A0ABY5VED5_9FIRM|nr:alcohol dehydrogenase catalytic domain-containing protein [Ruminococcus gauvreauii]UWP58875.1 alcohol dehydrogenase catalytic domain-containing protein [Ruminococcus gauvreauii]